ncbi:MAG TPA: hypothetical protein VFV01_38980 [Spirillospora sp.]|nr:hypothetical protein [Spirillospora sp.]
MQTGEGLLEFVTGDGVFLDVQGVEDGLVEEAALVVIASAVGGCGIFEEGEREINEADGVG